MRSAWISGASRRASGSSLPATRSTRRENTDPRRGIMPQAIAFHSVRHDSEQWRRVIQARHPDLEWRLWPDETGDPADIVFSLIRRPPMGELARYPNLKGIFSYGAGVEHLLQDPGLPRGVPIVRLIDPTLAQGVVQFIIERVLHMHRDFHRYPTFQRQGSWTTIDYPEARDRHIGILGCGYLGGRGGPLPAAPGLFGRRLEPDAEGGRRHREFRR